MEINSLIKEINNKINKFQFSIHDELELQDQLFSLILKDLGFIKEYSLSKKNRIDFFHPCGLGIEIKVQGQKSAIYRQCKRYCLEDEIKYLLLISAKHMGLPEVIENKKTSVIILSQNWL